jgi:DNA-binding FadR family transcriptional regulator
VLERLRGDLLGGRYPVGTHLPPERQLAERLGISRLTLRAALARLEAEGLVRARQGDGVRVLDPWRHATLAMLEHLPLAGRAELMRSFLELRRAVAAEALALACERATEADVDAIAALVEAQRGEADPEAYVRRDLAISRAVLEAARSPAMLLLLNAIEPVYLAQPDVAAALVADRAASIAGYDVALAALRARATDAARTTLRAALEAADAEAVARVRAQASGAQARGPRVRGRTGARGGRR